MIVEIYRDDMIRDSQPSVQWYRVEKLAMSNLVLDLTAGANLAPSIVGKTRYSLCIDREAERLVYTASYVQELRRAQWYCCAMPLIIPTCQGSTKRIRRRSLGSVR
jgi:hypothetical protein